MMNLDAKNNPDAVSAVLKLAAALFSLEVVAAEVRRRREAGEVVTPSALRELIRSVDSTTVVYDFAESYRRDADEHAESGCPNGCYSDTMTFRELSEQTLGLLEKHPEALAQLQHFLLRELNPGAAERTLAAGAGLAAIIMLAKDLGVIDVENDSPEDHALLEIAVMDGLVRSSRGNPAVGLQAAAAGILRAAELLLPSEDGREDDPDPEISPRIYDARGSSLVQ